MQRKETVPFRFENELVEKEKEENPDNPELSEVMEEEREESFDRFFEKLLKSYSSQEIQSGVKSGRGFDSFEEEDEMIEISSDEDT